jgi:ubiquinone/menaquinone biosynthesis C-methylase UbiE
MKQVILKTFFDNYSQNVDNADQLGYWKLSDSIIEQIIQKHLNAKYTGEKLTILDAGCGTGRWIEKIIKMNPEKNLEFIAYDLFESMLQKARENLAKYSNIIFIQ